MKFKRLKVWQAILIVVGVILLAGVGAFLYVYLTSGLEGKTVYPEDIAFVIDDETSGYNTSNGQYEMAGNFDLTISTQTADANAKTLTLSFTINFTDQEIPGRSGYITDGNITIPQHVEVGKPFEVEVNQKEENGVMVNVGGISTIYAKTSDKTKLPISTKVAIDVPVYSTTTTAFYRESGAEVSKDGGIFRVTEKTNVVLDTGFFPSNSKYIYSDDISAIENKRVKLSYLEIVEGNGNFVMNKDEEDIYFSAVGELGSKSKVRIYTFKNAADQIEFYQGFTDDTNTEQIYNAAIQYLSSNTSLAVIEDVEMVIVQANVKDFRLTGSENLDLAINSLYSLDADKTIPSDPSHINLSISILDSANDGTSGNKLISMLKNVAVRAVKKVGDVFVATEDVKVVGLNRVNLKDDERNFTFINSNVRDLTNSYFEISSQTAGEYYLEFALMLRDLNDETEETYYIFGDEEEKIERIKLNFTEPQELNVGWADPSLEINMVVYSNAGATEYPTDLIDLVSVPVSNHYKKVVFFADFGELSESEILQYMDFKSLKEYSVGTLAELNSSELLVKKGGTFGLRFAVVKTDAYGNNIMLDDGTYDVSQWSSKVQVNAVETIASLEDLVSLDIDEKYEDNNGDYIIPAQRGSFDLVVDFDEDSINADLMASQLERFRVVVYDQENDAYLEDLVNVTDKTRVGGTNKFIFNLSFVRANIFENDKVVKLALVYTTPVRDVLEIAKDGNKTITVYFGDATSFEMGNIVTRNQGYYLAKSSLSGDEIILEEQNYVSQNPITTVDGFNQAIEEIIAKDKYGKVIENAQIFLTSNNTSFISVENNAITINNVNGGSCTLTIYSGSASAFVVINAGTLNITKVEYWDGEDFVESASKTNVTVETVGYKTNGIALLDLLKIYVDDQLVNSSNYYYTLPTYDAMADKDILFGSNKIISYVTENNEDLSSNAKVISFILNHDLAQDLTLQLNVIGRNSAINIIVNLVIKSNIESEVVDFSAVTKPADETGYIGVYASYEMDLNDVVQVELKEGNYSWADVTYEDEGYSITNGMLKFNEVYEKTYMEITLYKLFENGYTYNKTLKFVVYPNFRVNVTDSNVNFTALVNNDEDIETFFTITRIAGNEAVSTLSYQIIGNVPLVFNGNNIQENGTFNLGYGETYKTFQVKVLSDENEFNDYQNEPVLVDMQLDFGITYDSIASFNSWMKVVKYNGQSMILVQDHGSEPYIFTHAGSPSLKLGSIVNVSQIEVTSDTSVLIRLTGTDAAILTGTKIYLPIKMFKDNKMIATIQIPLVISAFNLNTIFAYYNNYNISTEGFDLATLLTQNYQSMELFATSFIAGTSTPLVYSTPYGTEEGIYGTGTIQVEIQNNVQTNGTVLASIDGNNLVLTDLAGEEDQFVVIKVTQTNNKSLVYYYRVKVAPNTTINANHPYGAEAEYLIITNANYVVDLASNNRFEINKQNATSTNAVKEIEVDGVSYTLDGLNKFTKDGNTYTLSGKISISFVDDQMTINVLDYTKAIKVVITKTYNSVVNGSVDYTFLINTSNYRYFMDLSAESGYEDNIWTVKPSGTTTLSATTKQTNRTSSGIATPVDTATVKTSVYYTYLGDYSLNAEGNVLTITNVGTVTYDYINKTVTVETLGGITQEHEITLVFNAMVYDGDDIVAGQMNIQTLTIIIPRTVIIEENTTDIYGGTTVDISSLVSQVKKFNGSSYETTAYTSSISSNNNFVSISGNNITIATLKEDKQAKFEVTITVDAVSYVFEITKMLRKNITYANGQDLTIDIQNPYEFAYVSDYYANETLPITLSDYTSLAASTGVTGTNKFESITCVATNVTMASTTIASDGTITLKTDHVSSDTVASLTLLITYRFNSNFGYTFYLKVRFTVKPNVVGSVNYPNPTGEAVLDYETIGTENNSATLTNSTLQQYFMNSQNPLASGVRVVFKDKNDTVIPYTYDPNDEDCLGNALVGVKSSTNVTLSNSNKTITLDDPNNPGEVVYTITYHNVSVEYKLYVVAGAAYGVKENQNINFKTEGDDTFEVIYKDALNQNYKIFENDRLVKLSLKDGVGTTYNNTVTYVEFAKTTDASDIHTISFKYKSEYDNSTIYLEAGKKLSGYEFNRIYYIHNGSEVDINIYKTAPTTTERVVATYRTKQGFVEVANYQNSLVNSIITNSEGSVTYTLNTGTLSATGTYKFRLDVDIDVEKVATDYQYVTINATDLSSPNNLINLAVITKPSTGLALTQDDIKGNEDITLSLSVLDDFSDTVYTNFKEHYPEFEGAFTISENTISARPLTWTEYEVGATDHRAYDYFLFGEGASNAGTFVMLKYTYSVGELGVSELAKSFYIMVKIVPDYQVTIDGVVATSVVSGVSTSSNVVNPIEVAWDSTNNNYSIQLVSKSTYSEHASDKVSIIKLNSASPVNSAASWTYTMTANEEDSGSIIKYNTDMSKLKYKNTALTSPWTWDKTAALIITNPTQNFFGTKYYKVKATNAFGYEADIYFTFLPTNNQEPSVSSSSMTEITEGDAFDIGAIYQTITTEVNLNQYGVISGNECLYTINAKDSVTDNQGHSGSLSGSGTTYTATVNGFTITVIYDSNDVPTSLNNGTITYTSPSQIKPLYSLTAANTIPTSTTIKLINIDGINAWGFSNSNIDEAQITNGGDYIDSGKMTLQYVTVQDIEFRYNNLNVGELTNLTNNLATAGGLKTLPSGGSADPYRNIANTFEMPYLESWIYSDSASITSGVDNPLTDHATVVAIITLKYESGGNIETYQVSTTLRVSRKLNIKKTDQTASNQAFVRDGVSFNIQNGNYILETPETPISKILDDTLVVTLPANPGSQIQRLTIGVLASDGNDSASFGDYTIENSLARPKTFYISISKLLRAGENEGYILKSGDQISLVLSNYTSNSATLGGEKFYVKYQGSPITTQESSVFGNTISTGNATVSEITTDIINIEHSDVFLENNGIKSVIKSYVVVYNGRSYRVEKEYLVTPFIYSTDMDPEILNEITNHGGSAANGYTVALATWSSGINNYELFGTSMNSKSSVSLGQIINANSAKLKFEIGTETVPGTATINSSGLITTRPEYTLGGNEYIHVYVYVKASGYDGLWGQTSGNDFFIGSIRIILA